LLQCKTKVKVVFNNQYVHGLLFNSGTE